MIDEESQMPKKADLWRKLNNEENQQIKKVDGNRKLIKKFIDSVLWCPTNGWLDGWMDKQTDEWMDNVGKVLLQLKNQ